MVSQSKFCISCKTIKLTELFYKSSIILDGYYTYCKDCCKIKRKSYKQPSKDLINNQNKVKYNKYKDSILKKNKEYYYNNLDKIHLKQKEYRRNNKYKINLRNRARREKISCAIDNNKLKELILEHKSCKYCLIELKDHNRHIDHIVPLSKGGKHELINLMPICDKCNMSKGSKLLNEWHNK